MDIPALSPETWPFSLEWLPVPAYLVGGAVRDALLGRRSEYLDLDFVLPEMAVQTARKIATHYKAGFVLLDADRQIARVVFKHATADFAQQEGSSLETDLARRDFTINAIAYNPHTGELFDPLQGYTDLQAGVIKMVSPTNLQDDPLRLLRAYRQAAQLGFAIDPATRSTIRHLSPLLSQVPAERVLAELRYLLRNPKGTLCLLAACEDSLLSSWFPNATSNLGSKLLAVDSAARLLALSWPQLQTELSRSLRDTINTSLLSIAKLFHLLPPTPADAEAQMLRLTYSNVEIRAVLNCIAHLPKLQDVATSQMLVRQQYFFFQGVGTLFPAVAVLAVASGTPVDAIAPLIQRYLNPDDAIAHPTPLVSGNELMRSLNLPPGRQIGQLLAEIQIARAEGRISTPAEALKFANLISKPPSTQGFYPSH